MAYYRCCEDNNIKVDIQSMTCPKCGAVLLFKGYEDTTMESDIHNALNQNILNFYIYKCSNVMCNSLFLEADIKGKFSLIK